MSEQELHADDPRLTAYALGELDPTEREAVERLLADSPAAQAAVREICDLAGLLTTELKQEPAPALTAAQRTAILEGKAPTVAARPATRKRATSRWISQFAALASMAALVAIAAFLPAPGNRSGDSRWSEYAIDSKSGNLPAKGLLELGSRDSGTFTDLELADDESRSFEGRLSGLAAGAAVSAASAGESRQGLRETDGIGAPRDGSVNLNGATENAYGVGGFGGVQPAIGRLPAMEQKLGKTADLNSGSKSSRSGPALAESKPLAAAKRRVGQPERYDRAPAMDPAEPRPGNQQPAAPIAPQAGQKNVLMADGSVRFKAEMTAG
ncbi:MAG: hypothetical protein ACM3U2_09155, partial [Deltaproteobacteria bacterium]